MLAAATLATGFVALWLASHYWTAVPTSAGFAQLADSELEPRLRTIAAKGDQGLEPIVQALGGQRAALRDAAFRVLSDEIDRCIDAPDGEGEPRLDRLARLLASHASEFEPESLSLAAALAERLIAVPKGAPQTSAERVHDCHVVLAAAARTRIRQHDTRSKPTRSASAEPTMSSGDLRGDGAMDIAPLFGGGIPVNPAGTDPARLPEDLVLDARPIRDAKPAQEAESIPTRLRVPRTITETKANAVASLGRLATTSAIDQEPFDKHMDKSTSSTAKGASESAPTASKNASVDQPESLVQLLDVDARVRSTKQEVAASAKEEMSRLGIDEAQLELARGAIDSDPRVRKELVEALAVVSSVDSRRWLVWLSYDADTEVRRAAISLLATSSDPELKKRVREAADSDADSRIREQARAVQESAKLR